MVRFILVFSIGISYTVGIFTPLPMGNSVGDFWGSTEKPVPKLLCASGIPGLFSLVVLFG